MDLETREGLAFSTDRDAALAQLLPGSPDHDYFHCLRLQHAGQLDAAEAIIEHWSAHHGYDERLSRLQLRQYLYRARSNFALVADKLRDQLDVSHWHEAEVEEIDPTRATRLAADEFSGAKLLEEAFDEDSHLSQVTDEGLYELLGRELDATQRRALLARIGHTPDTALVTHVAADIATRDGGGFGSLAAHQQMTLEQLRQLGELRRELRSHAGWVAAVVSRMTPPHDLANLTVDLAARLAYLEAVWAFVGPLPEMISSLKVHVLWHLLDTRRRLGMPADATLFETYLALPRNANYLPSRFLEKRQRTEIAVIGTDFMAVTGLSTVLDDEPLVRALLHELVDQAERFSNFFDRDWLEREIATAQLLAGHANAERATRTLGPAVAAELRERVELAWCAHCPTQLAADAPVVLEADVKNVPELTVKVFRVDPHAYFVATRKAVGADLDLDGLAATSEQVLRFTEPPVRRVRRRIELAACTRPGTYVVDLIGNGMSSRAVINKGRLRHATRFGAAGTVVTVVDEMGIPRADARATVGEREYVCNEQGSFVIPFSTAVQRTPMLLVAGDIATVTHVELGRETPTLELTVMLDREGLTAGRSAKAIVRARLAINYGPGEFAPASLTLLKQPMLELTLTDRAGVQTTKAQPIDLFDDDATVVEWPLGEDTAALTATLRGTLEIRSEQREQELTATFATSFGGIHATTEIEAMYLARTAGGWVISALGKTGEPRAQRSVTVGLTHRWSRMQQNVELATDARGRVELGELPGIARITVTLGNASQLWSIDETITSVTPVNIMHGDEVVLPVPPERTAAEVIRRLSVVEVKGPMPVTHPAIELAPLATGVVIRGLPPGSYHVRGAGVQQRIFVAPRSPVVGRVAFTSEQVVELSRVVPTIASLDARDGLHITLRDANADTRVHVLCATFAPALVQELRIGGRFIAQRRTEIDDGIHYVSGRELGDEYRYVLERRTQKRYPGVLLDKPTLLLNPWARRTTSTQVATARLGGNFAAQAMRAAPMAGSGYGGGGMERGGLQMTASYDFLRAPPEVLANLVPDEHGVVRVTAAALRDAATVIVLVDDPAGMAIAYVRRPEVPLVARDLRLRLALDPARHATQQKAIRGLVSGERLVIDDLATAKVHLVDSVERAHAYLLALNDDATLREFAFVTRWHTLSDGERRALYSKYACHELHLFLWAKDPAFFTEVVKPYLAHKRTKTFVDHFLLAADLAPYLEPVQLAKLNAVERALLVRRVSAGDALARLLADEVAVLPPDPARDTRLIDTLLGAAALDGDDTISAAADDAYERAESAAPLMELAKAAFSGPGGAPSTPMSAPASMAAPPPPPAPAPKMAKKQESRSRARDEMDADAGFAEQQVQQHYRAVDKTQEWAENNWWHLTPSESTAQLIPPNRLWRDYAAHRTGAFLSSGLGLATRSFAEAMCALAVIDLPFVAGAHVITADGPRLEIVAAATALAGTSQLVDGELVATGAPLVIGSSFVRTDDRYDWVDGEQLDKYVTGQFATGVVYTFQVVLANPTSARQRIAALVQIPRGSIAVAGAKATQTVEVVLEPYGTHGHEVSFYFPASGTWSHFPVHASRGGVIVAAAPARDLEVTSGAIAIDPRSWPYISQRGSVADVVAYLATANLAAIELEKVAWRMRDRAAYTAILATLEARHAFNETLWGYALLHADAPRMLVYLRARVAELGDGGPVLEMLGLDAEDTGAYEHLELAPLVNARAHRLGPKLRILNDGLSAQYLRFLDLVAHRPVPTAKDLLAATTYLLALDRVEAALATLARVDPSQVEERLQHAYLVGYAALCLGDVATARASATAWREHPVDRWRHKFSALSALLDEVEGITGNRVVDPRNREQQLADIAATQPAFELALDREGIVLTSQNVTTLELRFFEMDVELLFSRQPFVQSDVSRFSFIEPGHRQTVSAPPAQLRVPWPAALRGKNVVVEAVGAGQRKAKVHYANDLTLSLSNQVGQVRVLRASDQRALPATYVKIYARKRGGEVTFYKDGYTDLRGWFDYATLATTELDSVERFAILVVHDEAGAAIVEAAPPLR